MKSLSTKVRSDAIVVFDLKDARIAPYHLYLISLFHLNGCFVLLKSNFRFIDSLKRYRHLILKMNQLAIDSILFHFKKFTGRYYFYDKFHDAASPIGFTKIFKVDLAVFGNEAIGKRLPYHMAPHLYSNKYLESIPVLRRGSKEIRIFFSGNQDPNAYNHPVINNYFGKLSRIQSLQLIKSQLSEDEIEIVTGNHDYSFISANKFILREWTWSHSSSNDLNNRIDNELWLSTLSKSHFFFCPSGIRMPICFNCVEAMSVGTIPILEYPEFFDPPLEHMKNAIIYNGGNDLIEKIRFVLSMDVDTIGRLSENVSEYFDRYLAPEQVFRELLEGDKECILAMYAEQASLDDSGTEI